MEEKTTIMALAFFNPSEKLFGFKIADSTNFFLDRMPETSPLRDLYVGWERKFVEALLQHWQTKLSLLVPRLRQFYPEKSAVKQDPVIVIDNLEDFWKLWADGYYEELLPYISEAAGLGAQMGNSILERTLGIGVDPLIAHNLVSEWAREHTAKLVKKRSRMFRRTLTDNDIRAIQNTLADWYPTGQPFNELVKSLQDIVVNKYRAKMIAATESTRAYGTMSQEIWKESEQINAVRWNTANDERVCVLCGELSGKLAAPGDFEFPAHVNCRCWPTPVIARWIGGEAVEGPPPSLDPDIIEISED